MHTKVNRPSTITGLEQVVTTVAVRFNNDCDIGDARGEVTSEHPRFSSIGDVRTWIGLEIAGTVWKEAKN